MNQNIKTYNDLRALFLDLIIGGKPVADCDKEAVKTGVRKSIMQRWCSAVQRPPFPVLCGS